MSQALPNSSKSRARVRPHSCVHCQAIRPKKPERLYYTPGDSAALKKPLEYFSFYIYEFIRLNVSYADLQNWPADNCEFARYVCQRLVEEGTPEGVDPAAIHFFLELRSGKVRFLSGMIHLQSVRDMQGPCKSWMVPPEEERGLCYVYAVAVGCCLTVGEDGVPGDGVGVLDGMALEPLSPDTVEAIRGWMARCGDSAGDEHKACSIAERDFAPARLVKLEEDAAGVRLSLVCGPCSSSCDSVEYAALSYCWGGSQEKQLTLANRAIYEKEIPWYSLPKALQDAATATLSLGLHYLWVDSLCIVQDDEEDKTTSISQMTKVYTHASITIINRRGDKVTDGFLHPRTHPHGSIYMRYNTENGAYGWATLTFDDTLLEGYRSAIDSRGWTMQEHLLSRRVVAVGPWITEWSCRTERLVHTDGWRFPSKREMSSGDILSTSLPNFLINKPFHDHDNNIKPISPDQLGNKYDADAVIFHFLNPNTYYQRPTQQSVKEIWRELVAAYSTRSLSVPSDLILAIAGLAEAFAPFISNSQRYLAGLWETELPASLLWMYDYRSTPRIRRPKTYQAPSWSWACIAAPIRHDYNLQGVPFWQDGDALNDHRPEYRFRCTATLLSISYSLANSIAPFGAVRSAALRIRGPAFRIESRCVHPSRAEPDLNGIPVSRWRDSSGKLHELDGIWFKLELDAREEGSGWMQIVLLGIARRGPDAHMGLALTLASESDGAGAGKSVRRREDGSGCRKGDRFRRLGVFHYNVENSGLPGSDTWPLEQMEIV